MNIEEAMENLSNRFANPNPIPRRIQEEEYEAIKSHKESQEKKIAELKEVANKVAHIGVDFGYGDFELGVDDIKQARELLK